MMWIKRTLKSLDEWEKRHVKILLLPIFVPLGLLSVWAIGGIIYDRFYQETSVESFDIGDKIVFVENTAF